ncbi:hypothetical protein [Marinoscillum pacificum]|uniref:hypothetical protein n=1 Tax=Marinoscillum pacificum TaxID=392723 RepID=UPI002157C8B5|nr:hypothetical protein [Marinoscillum pacificum]
MKRLITTLKTKWPEYFFEIFVLVIGIYGALELENWNEDQKRQKDEIEMLGEIANSLEQSLSRIDNTMGFMNQNIEQLHLIGSYIENGSAYDEDFSKALAAIGTGSSMEFDQSAYENLKVKGLDLISNENLRRKIIATYENEIAYLEKYVHLTYERIHKNAESVLGMHNSEVFIQKDPFAICIIPNNYEELIKSREFKNTVTHVEAINVFFIEYLVSYRNSIDSVRVNTQSEILRLK